MLTTASRCPTHAREHDASRRPSPDERGYDAQYRGRRAQALYDQPWCHSDPCPYADAGSTANPLTADHDRPVSLGGYNSTLTVRCRRCNSARGNRDLPIGH